MRDMCYHQRISIQYPRASTSTEAIAIVTSPVQLHNLDCQVSQSFPLPELRSCWSFVIVVCHLQSDPLVTALDVKAFVRFGAVENGLMRTTSAWRIEKGLQVKHCGEGVCDSVEVESGSCGGRPWGSGMSDRVSPDKRRCENASHEITSPPS